MEGKKEILYVGNDKNAPIIEEIDTSGHTVYVLSATPAANKTIGGKRVRLSMGNAEEPGITQVNI